MLLKRRKEAQTAQVSLKSKNNDMIPPSTLAAASTLGVAAILSAVSSDFSEEGAHASSVVSDSEDESLSQNNEWNESNLDKSKVKSPKKDHCSIKYHSDSAWRDEIKVKI